MLIATLRICKCGWISLDMDMATDFPKEQYAGVYKSFYDFASRYYGIDNLLAGSGVSPSTFTCLMYRNRVNDWQKGWNLVQMYPRIREPMPS